MLIDVSVLMPASSVASSLPPPLEQAARASTLVAATAASAALRVILNFPPEKGGGLCGAARRTAQHVVQRSAGVWRHGSQANSGQIGQFTERNPIVTRLILSGTSHHLEPAAW